MKITKENRISGVNQTENDMALINSFARKTLEASDVYTFSVVLCDNEVDRDNEAFTIPTLERLSKLFVGKTGIFDHDASANNQCARIYDCEVKADESKLTELGEVYTYLEAKAYIPVSEKEIIEKIESGILKEVSVSCSVKSGYCSICSKESCRHIKGKTYGGKRAIRRLDEASDAYEFSFVAIPAQRNAGVKKSFGEVNRMNVIEKLMSTDSEIKLTKSEAQKILSLCESGRLYREKLENGVVKSFMVTSPELGNEIVLDMIAELDINGLQKLHDVMAKEANKKLPLNLGAPQTTGEHRKAKDSQYDEYSI